MRILSVYNHYLNRGGEDEVFDAEAALLASHGHEVLRYSKHNKDLENFNALHLGLITLWNHSVFRELVGILRARRPDLVHFHNTFPLISPAAYWAVKGEGIPVVQTLHNFRMLCPNALLYRDGHVCEQCIGKPIALPGVVHGCYQGSRVASAGVAAMLAFHRLLRTWRNQVDVYIALTEFARAKFIQGGLPAEKIVVKHDCIYPEPLHYVAQEDRKFAVFVGRLSENKGITVLLEAWRLLNGRIPLKIIGDGPLSAPVAAAARSIPGLELTGRLPRTEIYDLLKRAVAMIIPSTWYEGMPMTIVEAYASSVPVIASRLGAMGSLVKHGETGLLFPPGDAQALALSVSLLLNHPADAHRMGVAARQEFENYYTAEINYKRLMEIYVSAITSVKRASMHSGSACPEIVRDC